ncbi:MAG TPA: DoxX family protein [Actinomycetota bacterium]|nr:DoxX family protein [Actinomycetota bacterium]
MQAFARRLGSFDHLGLLGLRIGVGVVMAWHGWQKVDGGVTNFAGFVESLGIPAPTFMAYLVTGLELLGGLALVIGVLTRVIGGLIAIEMALTGFWVKGSKLDAPFIGTEGTGIELDFVLMTGALALFFLGAGRLSIDQAVGLEERAEPAPAA